jgi:hypothetical protein
MMLVVMSGRRGPERRMALLTEIAGGVPRGSKLAAVLAVIDTLVQRPVTALTPL